MTGLEILPGHKIGSISVEASVRGEIIVCALRAGLLTRLIFGRPGSVEVPTARFPYVTLDQGSQSGAAATPRAPPLPAPSVLTRFPPRQGRWEEARAGHWDRGPPKSERSGRAGGLGMCTAAPRA